MHLASYEFLPAPLWLVTILHVVTLTLHFAAMNFLFGGVVVVLLGRFHDRWRNPAVHRLLRLFPSAMAATITFGVAPLLFLQLVYHRQAYAAAIVSAWFWLLILVVALVVYYVLYAAAPRDRGRSGRPALLWLALAGFVYISFAYSSVFSMAERTDLTRSLYAADSSGWTLNPDVGSYLARWLHMVLGAITVGAFGVAVVGRGDAEATRAARLFFLGGMAATAFVGVVYVLSLGELMGPLMHGAGIWWLTAAVALAIGSVHYFVLQRFLPAGALLGVSLLGMVALRQVVRDLHLAGAFDPAILPVRPQWSVFVLFLICFVLAAALLAYMARLFLRGTQAPDA